MVAIVGERESKNCDVGDTRLSCARGHVRSIPCVRCIVSCLWIRCFLVAPVVNCSMRTPLCVLQSACMSSCVSGFILFGHESRLPLPRFVPLFEV